MQSVFAAIELNCLLKRRFLSVNLCMRYVKSRMVRGILQLHQQRAQVSYTRHVTYVSLAWPACTPRRQSAITTPFVAPGQCSAARLLPRGVRALRQSPLLLFACHLFPGVAAKNLRVVSCFSSVLCMCLRCLNRARSRPCVGWRPSQSPGCPACTGMVGLPPNPLRLPVIRTNVRPPQTPRPGGRHFGSCRGKREGPPFSSRRGDPPCRLSTRARAP